MVADDRQRGFDPQQAPLMRFALIQRAGERASLVWTFHHLLLDGWSVPVIFGELFAAYEARVAGRAPGFASGRPFRDYLDWLQAPGSRGGGGASGAGSWPISSSRRRSPAARTPGAEALAGELVQQLDPEPTAATPGIRAQQPADPQHAASRARGPCCLAAQRRRTIVVFGVTVAGRPAGAGRRRDDGRPVHQHPAGARAPARRGRR